MTAQRTAGLVILHEGRIRLERYGLDFGPGGRWTSFSVAKSLTSTLVGAAIRDGRIRRLDDKVSDYIAGLKGSAYDDVSIEQLLTMTSGVRWNEDYSDRESDVARFNRHKAEPGVDTTVSYMRRLPREFPPGSRWVYKTGETNLIGVLVSSATGRPLADYLSEKIWSPFGMEQKATWILGSTGHEISGCCLQAATRDFARVGLLMLSDGVVDGKPMLPAGWIARATTREIWMSQSGAFDNFRDKDDGGEVVADSAVSIEVASDQANRIEWMLAVRQLIVGTAGGEFTVGEITGSEAFGPGNAKAEPVSNYGSKPVHPARVGDSLLFVQRSGRKMRDILYTLETEGYRSTNLSVLSRHLVPGGMAITHLAFQQEPNSVIWALRSDGKLLATTLNANQKRFGWHRHPIGGDGIVEAIDVIPSPNGDADELWMIVRRTINNTTVRYVEYMEQPLDAEQVRGSSDLRGG